ncbi:unnamed protein product [Lampetra fluviatilis]
MSYRCPVVSADVQSREQTETRLASAARVRGGHRWGEREMWLLSIRASGAETRTAVPWRCGDGGSGGGGGGGSGCQSIRTIDRRLFPAMACPARANFLS